MATRYLDESMDKFKQLDKVIKGGFKITSDLAEDLEIGDEAVNEMRELMLGYAALEQNMKNCLKAAQETKSNFEQNLNQDLRYALFLIYRKFTKIMRIHIKIIVFCLIVEDNLKLPLFYVRCLASNYYDGIRYLDRSLTSVF